MATLDAPEPGTARYERALFVLWSGHYDSLTGTQCRDLIDGVTSDHELDRRYPLEEAP